MFSPGVSAPPRPEAWRGLADGAGVFARAFAAAIAPDPEIRLSDWAAEHLVVADGPQAGQRWDPTLTPFLTGILDCLSPRHPCTRVAVRKSGQIGYTGMAIAWLAAIAACHPAPTLVVMPTAALAKDFNREKLQPTIDATPVLRGRIREHKSRAADSSTTTHKRFAGGHWALTGANSTAALRSRTVRYACCDEVDDWPADLDGQGDPSGMVDARMIAYTRAGTAKRLDGSTPTIEGTSRIDALFEAGDQRWWHVPCPHCGEAQVLRFEALRFRPAPPHDAHLHCAECGCRIDHAAKAAMVAAGRWIATAPGPGRYPSFHLDAMVSPFVSWDDIAAKSVAAEHNPEQAKTFANLWLGRSYKTAGEAPPWQDLYHRARDHGGHVLGTVPPGALFLTMGVDAQPDRLEASVWGWGVGKTAYLIDHHVLAGDTNLAAVWDRLSALHLAAWPVAGRPGLTRTIELTAVDAGFRPDRVYQWVAGRPRAVAVKGYAGHTDWPIGLPKTVHFDRRGRAVRGATRRWMAGSSYLKAEIYGYLALSGPDEAGRTPPGFVHLPRDVAEDTVQQLTAERMVPRRNGGTDWVRVSAGIRNEVLDCAVYARAAAYHPDIGMGRFTARHWQDLAAARDAPPEPAQRDLLAGLVPRPAAATPPAPPGAAAVAPDPAPGPAPSSSPVPASNPAAPSSPVPAPAAAAPRPSLAERLARLNG